MIDKVYIGKVIKTLRKQKNLTQDELAEKIDISPNYLSKVERGISILNAETFLKMATVLSFSLEDFGINTNNKTDIEKEKIIQRILTSSEKNIKIYKLLLNTLDNIQALQYDVNS